jgi:hypothetical protein
MIGRVALLVTFKKAKPKSQSLSRSHIRDLCIIQIATDFLSCSEVFRTMRTNFLRLTLFVIALSGGFYILLIEVDSAVIPDPDYNTIYSEFYDEEEFKSLKRGMLMEDIIASIGNPLESFYPKEVHKVLFSDYNVSIDHGAGVYLSDSSANVSFLVIDLDSRNKTNGIYNKNYIDESIEQALYQKDYDQILSEFGPPKQELNCRCEGAILSYSDLKQGPYRGKHPFINIRRLVLTSDKKLDRIILETGNPFNKYVGLCTE